MTAETDRLERLSIGERYGLLDAQENVLGSVRVVKIQDKRVTGTFRPGPAFARVRDVFAAHAEAIDDMMMAKVEQLHQTVEALGAHLETSNHQAGPLIHKIIIREQESEIYFHLRGGYSADFQQLQGATPLPGSELAKMSI